MNRIALAVTVHDPEERWLRRFEPGIAEIAGHYDRLAAACTEATSRNTALALAQVGFIIRTVRDGGIGAARRAALETAVASSAIEWVHYADLDRLLHWQYTYPDELRETLRATPHSDYVALGRTPRALATHPRVQVLAETLTNAAFAAALGLNCDTDLVAGSALLSRRAADAVLKRSVEDSGATDLEWPAIVFREYGVVPEFRALEGLEFETASYYGPEIAAAGSLAAWVEDAYNRPQVWAARAKLAYDSIRALARVLDRPDLTPAGRSRSPIASTEDRS